MGRKKIVVLTGAGMSAESGIATFRDNGGLWDKYDVMEVASHEGWLRNPELVREFYNVRRKELLTAEPNEGHRLVAALEKEYDVTIVTQNVDNLHEKAGSTDVIHLHGELMKVTSSREPNNPRYIEQLKPEQAEVASGMLAKDGSPVRPFIVFFGEDVPNIEPAACVCMQADILVVIGTSLNVYPAAGLINYINPDIPVYLIDPKPVQWASSHPFRHFMVGASEGMRQLTDLLTSEK